MKIQLNESYYWDEKVCISFTPEKKIKYQLQNSEDFSGDFSEDYSEDQFQLIKKKKKLTEQKARNVADRFTSRNANNIGRCIMTIYHSSMYMMPKSK